MLWYILFILKNASGGPIPKSAKVIRDDEICLSTVESLSSLYKGRNEFIRWIYLIISFLPRQALVLISLGSKQ